MNRETWVIHNLSNQPVVIDGAGVIDPLSDATVEGIVSRERIAQSAHALSLLQSGRITIERKLDGVTEAIVTTANALNALLLARRSDIQGGGNIVSVAGKTGVVTLEVNDITGLSSALSNISMTPGPPGTKGDRGDVGPIGPQGVQGNDGPIGPQGNPGTPGATGAAGGKGDKGDSGERGVDGPTGPQGVKGDTGSTGATGPIGPAGSQGVQGIAGTKGDKGDKGDAGDPASNIIQSVNDKIGAVVLTAADIEYSNALPVKDVLDDKVNNIALFNHVNDNNAHGLEDVRSNVAYCVGAIGDTIGQLNQETTDRQQADATLTASKANASTVNTHIANTANPHNTTAAQVGALPINGGALTGPLSLNNQTLFISGQNDSNHTLRYDEDSDGPVLKGFSSVRLQSENGGMSVGSDGAIFCDAGGSFAGDVNAPNFVGNGYGLKLTQRKTATFKPVSNDDATMFFTDVPIQISKIVSIIKGGTSQNFELKYGSNRSAAGTSIASVTANSQTTGVVTTASVNVPANSFVWITTDATTPTVSELSITVKYNET